MARLAADLHDLLQILDLWVRACLICLCLLTCWRLFACLYPTDKGLAGQASNEAALERLQDATVVGSSMGASIVWSYIELYGHQHLGKLVFVDQTPLQVRLLLPAYGEVV